MGSFIKAHMALIAWLIKCLDSPVTVFNSMTRVLASASGFEISKVQRWISICAMVKLM